MEKGRSSGNLGAVVVAEAKQVAMVNTFHKERVQGPEVSTTFAVPMFPRYMEVKAMNIGESYSCCRSSAIQL